MSDKKDKLHWWRWRELSSAGVSRWWYERRPTEEVKTVQDLEAVLADEHRLHNYSEHYRGIEGQKVSRIPREALLTEIQVATRRMLSWTREAEELEDMYQRWFGEMIPHEAIMEIEDEFPELTK